MASTGVGMMELPRFMIRPECPKCLDQRFDWAWHGNHRCVGPNISSNPDFGEPKIGEHLHLFCVRCGHEMVMKTKDAA